MTKSLKKLIEEFGSDRYWQDYWTLELARIIRRNFTVTKKSKRSGDGK